MASPIDACAAARYRVAARVTTADRSLSTCAAGLLQVSRGWASFPMPTLRGPAGASAGVALLEQAHPEVHEARDARVDDAVAHVLAVAP